MTPMPRLVLLTEHFPFGYGEPFLETEVPHLAHHFKLEIVPTAVYPAEFSLVRPLPEGVRVRADIARAISYAPARWLRLLLAEPDQFPHTLKLLRRECARVPRLFWTIRRFIRFTVQAVLVATLLQKDPSLQRADVFYSYWLTSNALSLVLDKEAGQRARFVSRAHGGDLYTCLALKRYQPYQKRIVASLDHVICISEHGRHHLSQRHPAHEQKLKVSRLGVRATDRRAKPGNKERLCVVTCGNLVAIKRIHLVVEALALCAAPVAWTHLGSGPLETSLKAGACELPSHIHWRFAGQVSNRAVLDFYRSQPVDLFLNVSSTEGLPVSIMEAMSFGIPVVATEVGGTPELVNDGNGRLLPASISADELAAVLTEFHTLPADEKLAMREAAWQTWSEKANAEQQYGDFAIWLRNLVG